jgi:hypothetical protein
MKLYIEVENGNAIQHPAFEDNLNQAFPEGIPDRFEPFERIGSQMPVGTFQKSVVAYVKNENGVWNDVWSIEQMSEDEKQIKINQITENVNRVAMANENYASSMILKCTAEADLNGVNAWNNCLNEYKSWKLMSVLPTTPRLPALLRKDIETGEWVPI